MGEDGLLDWRHEGPLGGRESRVVKAVEGCEHTAPVSHVVQATGKRGEGGREGCRATGRTCSPPTIRPASILTVASRPWGCAGIFQEHFTQYPRPRGEKRPPAHVGSGVDSYWGLRQVIASLCLSLPTCELGKSLHHSLQPFPERECHFTDKHTWRVTCQLTF